MFSTVMQRVEEQLTKQLPFVVYRKPNRTKVSSIFQHTDKLQQISDYNTSGFVFAPFDSKQKSILITRDEVLIANDFTPNKTGLIDKIQFDLSQKEAHTALVEKAIHEIRKEQFQKVVLSRKIALSTEKRGSELFKNVLSTYPSAFCYLWFHPKVGMWLGATPEILLRADNQQFVTMSLAGTQPYQTDQNVEWGKKELEEQSLVTDYIKSAIKDKVSDLRSSDLETIKAGNLLHLRTKLTGRLTSDLNEVIHAMHPTPAVCGMPLSSTIEFILGNENYEREFYTGFLGELNIKEERQRTSNRRNQENQAYRTVKNKSELFVNLRCLKLENGKATIYVGGGVTGDSNPQKEWQETVNKSATMLRILS